MFVSNRNMGTIFETTLVLLVANLSALNRASLSCNRRSFLNHTSMLDFDMVGLCVSFALSVVWKYVMIHP